jgi:hypothetical protein
MVRAVLRAAAPATQRIVDMDYAAAELKVAAAGLPEHARHCNLMLPSTLNTDDDFCSCGAYAKEKK